MIGLFTRNWGWKLLSLGLAMLLWLVIVRDPDLATVKQIPVLYRGMPENLEINSELVETVQVEVRGPSGQLTPSSLSNAMVILDLGNVDRPMDRTYQLTASNVSLPRGVNFSRAVPSQIRIRFENRVTREVPVLVRFSTAPPEGYTISAQAVTPSKLRVVGPESNVGRLEFVVTDSIALDNVVGSAEFQVHPYISDPQVRFESRSPLVSVRVSVQKVNK